MPSFDTSWLIYLGAALLLIAYSIRDELKLRVLIVVSTFVYMAYYFLLPGGPLWDPIITSVLFVAINFWVLGQIALERTTLRLADDEKRLFEAFETLSPGQFRRVLKIALWRVAQGPDGTVLTREDEPSDALFFVFEGVISVEKRGRQFGCYRLL